MVAGSCDSLPGQVAGQVPVDRAALPREQLPEPLERRADVAGVAAAEQRGEGVVGRAARAAVVVAVAVVTATRVEPEGKVAHARPKAGGRQDGGTMTAMTNVTTSVPR